MRIPLAFAALSHANCGFRSRPQAAAHEQSPRLIRIKARFSQSGHDFGANKVRPARHGQALHGYETMRDKIAFLLSVKLFRLLAINLAIGVVAALLMIGGLLALNPYGLRGLLLADRSGGAAIALLVFGFVVTFGSAAMGSAIMAIGRDAPPRGGKNAPEPVAEPVPVKIAAR
jgi:hypothetical protein